MLFGEKSWILESPFPIPRIYREPFARRPAYEHLAPHWLGSPLGQRYFVELLQRELPSPLWPPPVREAVIDAVADLLHAAVSARRRNGGAA